MTFLSRIQCFILWILVVAGVDSGPVAAQELELGLPVDCALGVDCYVQNYVDLDPGAGVLDAACGAATYDGHKGTDFRVLNTEETADVVAAAPGIVKGARNTMPDRLVLGAEDRASIKGRECGNGVVIAHSGGWETQYCHLRQGSVIVSAGQEVKRGDKLGSIGYSGFAAFPHVHLSVRKAGQVIDPFLVIGPEADAASRCLADGLPSNEGNGLWLVDADDLLGDASGSIIEAGFTDAVVSTADLEAGRVTGPDAASNAFVFFARGINLKTGDRLSLQIRGPSGVLAQSDGEPMPRQKAHWVAFAGRKLRSDRWPAGVYRGDATLLRGGKVIQKRSAEITLD